MTALFSSPLLHPTFLGTGLRFVVLVLWFCRFVSTRSNMASKRGPLFLIVTSSSSSHLKEEEEPPALSSACPSVSLPEPY